MVFAVNCGADGTTNSFTNFKSSALAVGAQLQAQASAAASSTPVATAAYGGVTIPPAPSESVVTVVVSVEASVWTSVYSSYPGSPQATPASLAGNVHQVVVGNSNGSLTYDPPFVAAQPRDTISFQLCVFTLSNVSELHKLNCFFFSQPPEEPHCHTVHLRCSLPCQGWRFGLWLPSSCCRCD